MPEISRSILAGSTSRLRQAMADRALELGAVERLALAVLLDHRQVAQLDPLEGREARPAALALAPAADRRAVLRRARILNLAVFMRAERAAHR